VTYGPALSDAQTRQQWVNNAAAIVRATRGKGLVWTGGVRQPRDLRAPYDIVNLGAVLQLNGDLSKHALSANARAALMHAYTRAGTLRAVVAPKLPPAKRAKLAA
ncbi:RNA-binding RNA processing protein rpp1, partial [Coemansia sp. RSA 2706]